MCTTATAAAHATAAVEPVTTRDPSPTLTLGSTASTVAAGGAATLPITVAGFDPDDAVLVKISNIPNWLAITDLLDNHTFGRGSAILTAAEVNRGLVLTSSYKGSGHPVATLGVIATNTTPGEVAPPAPKSITVTDPPSGFDNIIQGAMADSATFVRNMLTFGRGCQTGAVNPVSMAGGFDVFGTPTDAIVMPGLNHPASAGAHCCWRTKASYTRTSPV